MASSRGMSQLDNGPVNTKTVLRIRSGSRNSIPIVPQVVRSAIIMSLDQPDETASLCLCHSYKASRHLQVAIFVAFMETFNGETDMNSGQRTFVLCASGRRLTSAPNVFATCNFADNSPIRFQNGQGELVSYREIPSRSNIMVIDSKDFDVLYRSDG